LSGVIFYTTKFIAYFQPVSPVLTGLLTGLNIKYLDPSKR
jgi:hypothetical protein